jgi:DnaJ-class molecular chaperone
VGSGQVSGLMPISNFSARDCARPSAGCSGSRVARYSQRMEQSETPGKTRAVKCGECGGTGLIDPPYRLLQLAGYEQVVCGHCDGTGWVEKRLT